MLETDSTVTELIALLGRDLIGDGLGASVGNGEGERARLAVCGRFFLRGLFLGPSTNIFSRTNPNRQPLAADSAERA